MKRFFVVNVMVLFVLLTVFSCQKSEEQKQSQTIGVTGVMLNVTSISLSVGDKYSLTATVTPADATNRKVIWSSSDGSVATVSDGTITALKEGSATITVTTDDGGKTATCQVTVKSNTVSVIGVILDKTSAEMTIGEKLTLTATVTPDNATNRKVIWSSSDGSVATVSDGTITALKEGSATITVTTDDGGKTAICQVTVLSSTNVEDPVSGDDWNW